MISEEKKSQTQEQEEFLSVNVPDNHQSGNASGKRGLVSVVYHASWYEFDRETFAQKSSAQKKLQAYVEYRKMYKKLIKELASLKYKVDTYDAYAFEEKDGETLEDLNRELESKKREIEDFKKLF